MMRAACQKLQAGFTPLEKKLCHLWWSVKSSKVRQGLNPRNTFLTGFTLVELMMALSISGIVLTAGYHMFTGQRQTYSLQNEIAQMQQNVRASEHMIVREIRMAGYEVADMYIGVDVPGQPFSDGEKNAFEEATSQSIAFTSDVDGDGKMETIRYSLKKDSLARENWKWDALLGNWEKSGGARSMSENMEGLHFCYWILADDEGLNNNRDDDGDSYVDEEGELLLTAHPSKEEREHIRIVRLTLTAKSTRPDHHYIDPVHGDHFRRITLSSIIRPRNVGL